eukprot:gene24870-biopygen7434
MLGGTPGGWWFWVGLLPALPSPQTPYPHPTQPQRNTSTTSTLALDVVRKTPKAYFGLLEQDTARRANTSAKHVQSVIPHSLVFVKIGLEDALLRRKAVYQWVQRGVLLDQMGASDRLAGRCGKSAGIPEEREYRCVPLPYTGTTNVTLTPLPTVTVAVAHRYESAFLPNLPGAVKHAVGAARDPAAGVFNSPHPELHVAPHKTTHYPARVTASPAPSRTREVRAWPLRAHSNPQLRGTARRVCGAGWVWLGEQDMPAPRPRHPKPKNRRATPALCPRQCHVPPEARRRGLWERQPDDDAGVFLRTPH